MSILYFEWRRYLARVFQIALFSALLILFTLAIYPLISGVGFTEEIINSLDMIPDFALSTVTLYEGQDFSIGANYFSSIFLLISLISSIFSGWLGARSFAKEKKDGTFDFLLQKPLQRFQVILYKIVANIFVLLSYTVLIFIFYKLINFFLSFFNINILAEDISVEMSILGFFTILLFTYGIGLFFSSLLTNDRIAFFLTLISITFLYILTVYGNLSQGFNLNRISPYSQILPNTINLIKLLAFLSISIIIIGVSFIITVKRDIEIKEPHIR